MLFRIVFAILAIAAILPTASYAVLIDRIAAIVNDGIITQSEINAIGKLQLNISGLPPAESPLMGRVHHHLVLQQIERQPPPTVSREMVQETIEAFTREHGGNEELLLFMNSVGMNYEDFDREVREQLSIREFINLRFRPFVSVRIEDAEAFYNDVLRPELEKKGQPVPSFAESFEMIQSRLAESRVQERTKEWIEQLMKESSVYVKE